MYSDVLKRLPSKRVRSCAFNTTVWWWVTASVEKPFEKFGFSIVHACVARMQRKWDPISTDWLASFVNEVSKSRKEPKYNRVLFSWKSVFLQIEKKIIFEIVLNLKIVFFISRKSLINFDNRGYSGIQPNTKATKKLLRAVIQSHAWHWIQRNKKGTCWIQRCCIQIHTWM